MQTFKYKEFHCGKRCIIRIFNIMFKQRIYCVLNLDTIQPTMVNMHELMSEDWFYRCKTSVLN